MPGSGRLIASARLIALFTLCSRILGLLREVVFSYYFSTSELLSAFRIAFMAPNLARRLFGEGAMSSAMIPTLTDSLEKHGEKRSRRFVGTLFTVLALGLGAGVLAAELVIALWRSVEDDPALRLSAILMPYMVLICVVAIAGGVLNVRRHFATPAAVPVILNVCVIAGTTGGAAWAGLRGIGLMYVVCGSVLVAGILQLVASGLALRAVKFFPVFGGNWRDPHIRAVFALMVPMLVGLSAVQINTLADYLIAYLFVRVEGVRVGPAVLGYAHCLYQLPLGVFGISIATAIFPVLSRHAARGDLAGMAETAGRGLGLAMFVALPASVGLMFVAEPLVATLYERGEFDTVATGRVAATLFYYSLGLAAYFAQHVLVRAFYAVRDSRTPARVAMTMVAVNLVMNLSLVLVLEERGLALSTAICAALQALYLSHRLRLALPGFSWRHVAAPIGKALPATAAMAGSLAVLASSDVLTASRPFVRLAVPVVAGATVYLAAAWLLRVEELRALLGARGRASTAWDGEDPGQQS